MNWYALSISQIKEAAPREWFEDDIEPPQYGGSILLYRQAKQPLPIGTINFRLLNKTTVEMEYIHIDSRFQGRGYGRKMYQHFLEILQSKYPNVRILKGDVTSQGVLKLHNSVFGPPHAMKMKGKPVDELTASQYLPERSPEDVEGHGVVDLSKDRFVSLVHRLPSKGETK